MSGFYYKDWREVFKWPRIGDRGTGEAGNPQGSFGRAGGRRGPKGQREYEEEFARNRKQADLDAPDAIGSRPADENKAIWHVHDIFMNDEGRVDKERLISRHPTESAARRAGSKRAQQMGVAHIRQEDPGPYTAESSHGYTAQYEKPTGDMQEGLN